jgi:hypothetical protein
MNRATKGNVNKQSLFFTKFEKNIYEYGKYKITFNRLDF